MRKALSSDGAFSFAILARKRPSRAITRHAFALRAPPALATCAFCPTSPANGLHVARLGRLRAIFRSDCGNSGFKHDRMTAPMRADASAVARSMRPMRSRSPDFLTTLARSSSHRARRDDHVATHLFRISNRFGIMPNSRISSGCAIQRLFQIHTRPRARKRRTARGSRLPARASSRVRLGKTARLPRRKPIASARSRAIPVSCMLASPADERLHTARRSHLRRRASLCVHPGILTVGPR